MLLNQSIITRLIAASQIYKLISAIIAPVAIMAGVVWLLVFLIKIMVLGLQLISAGWSEASTLVANMPLLHFFVLLALASLSIVAVVKISRFTLRGVLHVRA